MNFVDRILFQCKLNPPAIAIGAPGTNFEIVSYGRLQRSIDNVCRRILGFGLTRGDRVALQMTDFALHAIVVIALIRLGIVPVCAGGRDLPKEIDVGGLITDTNVSGYSGGVINADPGWTLGEDRAISKQHVPQVNPDDLGLVLLTFGHAGAPKAIPLSHRMLSTRIARHQYMLGSRLPDCARTYCDMGGASALGFEYLAMLLSRGGAIFLPGTSLEEAVKTFEFFRVQNIVVSPPRLAELLDIYERNSSMPAVLELIHVENDAPPKDLTIRVRSEVCPNLVCSYGTAETSIVTAAPAQLAARTPGATGFILPDVTVGIVDESGQPVHAGEPGTVRLRGPSIIDCYLGDPDESAKVFRDGWFYPGTQGYRTPDSMLVLA